MNKSVVESSLDVAHSEDVLSGASWSGLWWSVVDNLLFLLLDDGSLLGFGLNTRNLISISTKVIQKSAPSATPQAPKAPEASQPLTLQLY